MAKRIALIVLVFTLAVAVIFTGCTPARRPYNTTDNYNRTGITNERTNYQTYPGQTTNYGARDLTGNQTNYNLGGNVNTNTQKSDTIARAVEQVPGVRTATAVVSGNTAYVGIGLGRTTGTTSEAGIKTAVAQKVRATDSTINTVYVSTDVTFMDRLRAVGTNIRNGRPVEAFTTELKALIQKITPTRW
jgi:YhcN/YlaJ family sporulation lipoprotein